MEWRRLALTLKSFRYDKKYFARTSFFQRCMIADKKFDNKKKIFPFGCCLSLCLGKYYICEEMSISICARGQASEDKIKSIIPPLPLLKIDLPEHPNNSAVVPRH